MKIFIKKNVIAQRNQLINKIFDLHQYNHIQRN
jgi:hypothetical protein